MTLLDKAARDLQPRSKAKTTVARGQVGYDNARENIDPRIITNELLCKWITLSGARRDTWPTSGGGDTSKWTSGANFIYPKATTQPISGAGFWTKGNISGAKVFSDNIVKGTIISGGTIQYDTLDPPIAAGGGGPRTRTLVVAAVDSEDNTGADYVCDGAADEAEINTAITSLSGHGGCVMLLDGTYTLASSILLNQSEVTIMGQGHGTQITGGSFDSIIGGPNVNNLQIKDIYFVGNAASTSYGIDMDSDYAKISTCWFYLHKYGIRVTEQYVTVNSCYFKDCGTGAYFQHPHGVISNSTFWGGTYAVNLASNGGCMVGCSVNDSDRGVNMGGNYNTVTGNYFKGCDFAGVQANGHNTITGNVFNENNYSIYSYRQTNITITGNYFRRGFVNDIYAPGANRFAIIGNVSFDGEKPIDIGDGTDNTITGNTIEQCDDNAIILNGATRNIVSGNNIHNAGEETNNTWAAISLTGTSTYNVVSNNIISSEQANKHKYGIEEASANDDFNIITGNIVSDAVTANYLIQGANTEVGHNIG